MFQVLANLLAEAVYALSLLESGDVEILAVIDSGIARRFGVAIDLYGVSHGLGAFGIADYEYDAFADMGDDYDDDENDDVDRAPLCESGRHGEMPPHVWYGWAVGDSGEIYCSRDVYAIDARPRSYL